MAEMRYQPKHTEGFFLDLVRVSLPLNFPFLICFSHPVTQLMKSFILPEYSYPTIKISPSFSPDQKKSSTELEYMSVLAREAVFPFAHQPFPVLSSLSTKNSQLAHRVQSWCLYCSPVMTKGELLPCVTGDSAYAPFPLPAFRSIEVSCFLSPPCLMIPFFTTILKSLYMGLSWLPLEIEQAMCSFYQSHQ